jgi:hypothetical protein
VSERKVPGATLNLSSTSYPGHGRGGDLLQGKISTAEPGIEPGTSWLVVRSSDHQVARLVNMIGAVYVLFISGTILIPLLLQALNFLFNGRKFLPSHNFDYL